MTAIKFENPINFKIEEAFTYGVCNGKYGGYCVPIKLDPYGDFIKMLREVAEKYGAQIRFYGSEDSTLYLRCDQLSTKQREELLSAGKMIIYVELTSTGTHVRKDGVTSLNLELTTLGKVRVPEKILRPAPEDY